MNDFNNDPEKLRALLANLRQKASAESSPLPRLSSSGATPPQTAMPFLKNAMIKLGQALLRTLVFVRIVNGDNNLSISNLAVMLMLAKMMLQPSIDLASAAALLTVIGGYNFKKWVNS